MDELREKRGIFKAEPASLFRGRGDHPKMGTLKLPLQPEEVLRCGRRTLQKVLGD